MNLNVNYVDVSVFVSDTSLEIWILDIFSFLVNKCKNIVLV